MVHLTNKPDNYSIPCSRSSNILLFLTVKVLFQAYRIKQLTRKCTGLSETANYGVSMTTITIVDSLWRHNENCCYANMRSQGQASCLLTLEFKCHLRYCSSQEVDVSLSHSAVLHYIGSGNGICRCQFINWTTADLLLIEPLLPNFTEIWIKLQWFSIKVNMGQVMVCCPTAPRHYLNLC